MDSRIQSSKTRAIDGDWSPSGTQFWIFAGNKKTDGLSYKVFSVTEMGIITDVSNLGPNNWHTYDFDSSIGSQHQKWVQVMATPDQGEPNFIVNVLDDDDHIYSISVPSVSTPSDTSGYVSLQVGDTGSYKYECFSVAWVRFAQ